MTRFLFLSYIIGLIFVAGFMQQLGPIWIEEISNPHSSLSAYLLTAAFLSQVPFFLLLPRLEEGLGFFLVLCSSLIVMILTLGILGYATGEPAVYNIAWVVRGVMVSAFILFATNLLQPNINPKYRNFYQNILMSVIGLGNCLAPFLLNLHFSPSSLSLDMMFLTGGLLFGAIVFLKIRHPVFLTNASGEKSSPSSFLVALKAQLSLLRHPLILTYAVLYQLNNTLPNFLVTIGRQSDWTQQQDLLTTNIVMASFVFLIPLGYLADHAGIFRTTLWTTITLVFLNILGLIWPPTWGNVAFVYSGINTLDIFAQALLYVYIAKVFPSNQLFSVLAASQVLSAFFAGLFNYILGASLAHQGFEVTQMITLLINLICLGMFWINRNRYTLLVHP